MQKWTVLLAVLALSLFATSAQAGAVGFQSDASTGSGLGSYSGSLNYTYDSVTRRGTLSVTLKNTSTPANGGYLTGFGLNIDGAARGALTGEPASSAWRNLSGSNALVLNPYGLFELGASTSDRLTANTNARSGLAVGDERTFAFMIRGAEASSLTSQDFFSESSTGARGTTPAQVFVARFGAFDGRGSDKVGAIVRIVPLPAAGYAGLLLLGGLGVLQRRRRRRRLS